MLLNRNNFVLGEIPHYLPILTPTSEYIQFWREQKRRCIEGYWSSGMWCPPQLYFYLNFWHIKVSEDVFSGNKKYSFPFFRELEWQKAYMYTEASGFSGFSEDEEFTCHTRVRDWDPEVPRMLPPECYRKDGTMKTYVDSRWYMQQFFPKSLGKPLYKGEKKNIVDIEARETGKSYWASCCIAHNFLFDGYTDYDAFLADQQRGVVNASETLVGSVDTKYSDDLLKKVQDGIRLLPWEERNVKGEKIPAFFAKETTGSWKAGPNPILANFEHKVPGGWLTGGSQSKIHHRSMADYLAGNGTRPNKIFIEEVGFQGNLLDLLGALRDCTTTSGVKIGSIVMMGTGGDMKGGATMAVQEVFFNPEEHDCVSFEDTWENSGKRIGFFACQPMADNEYLDKQTGKIDFTKGYQKSMARREKLKKGKSKTAYNKEMENKPLVPSEAFLVTSSNKFSVAELKDQLGMVQTTTDPKIKGTIGMMVRGLDGKPEFQPDLKDELRMPDFPIRRGDNDKSKGRDVETEGAVTVWEHPKPNMGYGLYGSGMDPYSKDDAPNSISLGSLFVVERGCMENGGYDRIVAEYTGRPESSDRFYEVSTLLIEWYNNHECLPEMNVNTFKGYLQNRNKLHLLALTPGIMQNKVKDSDSTYGVYVGNRKVKNELIDNADNWTRKKATTEGKLHLHFIYSVGLLKELIAFNMDGNFDRVIAFSCAVTQTLQLETIDLAPAKEQAPSVFAGRKFFTNHTSGYSPRSSSPQMRKPQHTFLPPHGR